MSLSQSGLLHENVDVVKELEVEKESVESLGIRTLSLDYASCHFRVFRLRLNLTPTRPSGEGRCTALPLIATG